ncbi:unnamed protein product, partial [Porites evermanni]
LADDSDDDKRIRQAEVRASQKRRRAQLAKKSSSLRPQKPSTPPVPSLPYVVSGYGTPVSPSYPAVSLPGSNFSNPFSNNNTSALAHSDFVNEAISELLVTNGIFESEVLPHNVNPLSVSIQSSGKKRLILDLRFVNKHVWKQ